MSAIVPYNNWQNSNYNNWQNSNFQVQIARMVSQGWRIEYLSPTQAVFVSGSPCNHILHLLITSLLCGFWLPIWLILAITQREVRATAVLLPNGQIHWS